AAPRRERAAAPRRVPAGNQLRAGARRAPGPRRDPDLRAWRRAHAVVGHGLVRGGGRRRALRRCRPRRRGRRARRGATRRVDRRRRIPHGLGRGRARGALARVKTPHGAILDVESYSPAEERFNRRRRTLGLALAPALFVCVWLLPLDLAPQAHRLAAILAMVVVLWVSEALPMPVTALLGPVLAIVLHVAPAQATLAPFADPIIFVFIGSFILAEAMFVHGLDKRIAYTALASRWVGASGTRILMAYGAVATGLSMWISNTATTAMMFPIGLSILAQLRTGIAGTGDDFRRFAVALMLITSFGASVGGLATPVGTPPNLIGIGLIERIQQTHIGFFQWMAIGLPIVIVLFVFLAALFATVGARGLEVGAGGADVIRRELAALGPVTRGQRNVLVAFGCTVCLWIAPGLFAIVGAGESAFARQYQASVPEGVAALIGAMLLFLLPVSWRRRQFTLT